MPFMKKVMMRCLLLVAAMGYFFAGLHSANHLHMPHSLHASSHQTLPDAPGDQTPDTAEADDCLICTFHSHAVATPPQWETLRFTPLFKDPVPLAELFLPHDSLNSGTLGARAPPIL